MQNAQKYFISNHDFVPLTLAFPGFLYVVSLSNDFIIFWTAQSISFLLTLSARLITKVTCIHFVRPLTSKSGSATCLLTCHFTYIAFSPLTTPNPPILWPSSILILLDFWTLWITPSARKLSPLLASKILLCPAFPATSFHFLLSFLPGISFASRLKAIQGEYLKSPPELFSVPHSWNNF